MTHLSKCSLPKRYIALRTNISTPTPTRLALIIICSTHRVVKIENFPFACPFFYVVPGGRFCGKWRKLKKIPNLQIDMNDSACIRVVYVPLHAGEYNFPRKKSCTFPTPPIISQTTLFRYLLINTRNIFHFLSVIANVNLPFGFASFPIVLSILYIARVLCFCIRF